MQVIVLLSGGLDSATVLAMCRAQGLLCHALSFHYGQIHAVELQAAARVARAPVAGVVAQVAVEAGQRVVAGQPLVCVEAMKMEMWQNAAAAGVVRVVHVALRDTVASGAVLVELDLDKTEKTA